MNTADMIYLSFEVLCFGVAGLMFLMMGSNARPKYQAMRQNLHKSLKFPDSDGLYDFFAVVLMLNVLRVIYPLF